jgi:hypothetical protein
MSTVVKVCMRKEEWAIKWNVKYNFLILHFSVVFSIDLSSVSVPSRPPGFNIIITLKTEIMLRNIHSTLTIVSPL